MCDEEYRRPHCRPSAQNSKRAVAAEATEAAAVAVARHAETGAVPSVAIRTIVRCADANAQAVGSDAEADGLRASGGKRINNLVY